MDYNSFYQKCMLCPRECSVNRLSGEKGFCSAPASPVLARAALHFWEEPCISGKEGSGAVFFSGCSLGCVFCQNYAISRKPTGKEVSVSRLSEIFFELKEQGANNINLVTADIYLPSVCAAIDAAKEKGFDLPFLYNCSSYMKAESLKMLDGRIDIYLPDCKFLSSRKAALYLQASDYPRISFAALEEMHRQVGSCHFDERGMLRKGMLIRHLLMPHGLLEAKMILKRLYASFGDHVYFSLLNQYTPISANLKRHPELDTKVTEREYDELIEYALSLGIKNAYMQEGEAISESFIPLFDQSGV